MILNNIRAVAFAVIGCSSVAAAEAPVIEVVSKPAISQPRSYGDSGELEFSADGKWALFTSTGNGVVTNNPTGFNLDVFLRNNETGEITLLSRSTGSPGERGDGHSHSAQLTADGNLIVFESDASNLVTNDVNDSTDVFLYQRSTGVLSILSLDSEGNPLDGASGSPLISSDGQTILFETEGALSDLDTNESIDLYRLQNGIFELVTTRSNDLQAATAQYPSLTFGTYEPAMSEDGRFIAFISPAIDHYAGVPSTAGSQIYLRDMQSQTNAWLTRSTNGTGATFVSGPVVSSNGSFVLFLSSVLLPMPTTPLATDMFLYRYDIPTGQLERVPTGNAASVFSFALSDNSEYVAFADSLNQVYLHHLATGTNILVSRTSNGEPAAGVSADPVISADGRYVVFLSTSSNLLGSASNDYLQAYSFDRESGEITLLSPGVGSGEPGATEDTLFPAISADGSIAGFMSYASNLVTNDNPQSNDLFLAKPDGSSAVILASAPHPLSLAGTASGQSYVEANALSLDGRYVIFSSEAPDLVANDTNSSRDVFLRDLQNSSTTLISTRIDGTQHTNASTYLGASLDGNVIAYTVSEPEGLTARRNIYTYDRSSGSNTVASLLPSGDLAATAGAALLSPNGRYLAFREQTSLSSPLYIRDLQSGTTVRHPPEGIISFGTEPVVFSPSGRYLLTIQQGSSTYALHDVTGPTHLTNVTSFSLTSQPFTVDESILLTSTGTTLDRNVSLLYLDGVTTNITIATNATSLAISPNGRTVVYLRRDYTNQNLYFHDVANNNSAPLSLDGTNVHLRVRPGSSFSANSRYFTFITADPITGGEHLFNSIYIYDTVLKTVRLANSTAQGEPSEFGAGNPTISANGRTIVFDTGSGNLVPGDLNLASDVFVGRFAAIDTDSDGLEDGWETIYFEGLASDGDADADNDGISNRDEYRAGTDPNNPSSMLSLAMSFNDTALIISAPCSPGVTYQLEHCADLSEGEWHAIGSPAVSLWNSISFEAPLHLEANGFFRITATN